MSSLFTQPLMGRLHQIGDLSRTENTGHRLDTLVEVPAVCGSNISPLGPEFDFQMCCRNSACSCGWERGEGASFPCHVLPSTWRELLASLSSTLIPSQGRRVSYLMMYQNVYAYVRTCVYVWRERDRERDCLLTLLLFFLPEKAHISSLPVL